MRGREGLAHEVDRGDTDELHVGVDQQAADDLGGAVAAPAEDGCLEALHGGGSTTAWATSRPGPGPAGRRAAPARDREVAWPRIPVLDEKLSRMRARVRELGSVLVCYSGGVDSAFVLAVAHAELGPRAVGMTAVSPEPCARREGSRGRGRPQIGADHRLVETREIDDPRYIRQQRRPLLPLQEQSSTASPPQDATRGASRHRQRHEPRRPRRLPPRPRGRQAGRRA